MEKSYCSPSRSVAHLHCVNKVAVKKNGGPMDYKTEARDLRRFAKRIAGSKIAARRFLAATGMYTLKGEVKPQFR
jgi:hypothetical protein